MEAELARALDEFFQPTTSNDRKRAIEESLRLFENEPRCVVVCQQLLASSNNHLVLMYTLHCIEECVNGKGWHRLDEGGRDELRSNLLQAVSALCHPTTNPPFVGRGMIKVLACALRLDWKAFKGFEYELTRWLSSPEAASIGLGVLTGCAEALSPGAKCPLLTVDQFAEQRAHFAEFLHRVGFTSLTAILRACAEHASKIEHDDRIEKLMIDGLHCACSLLENDCVRSPATAFAEAIDSIGAIALSVKNEEIAALALRCLTELMSRPFVHDSSLAIAHLSVALSTFGSALVDVLLASNNLDESPFTQASIEFYRAYVVHILARLSTGQIESFRQFMSSLDRLTQATLNRSPTLLQSLLSTVWSPWLDRVAIELQSGNANSAANVDYLRSRIDWFFMLLDAASNIGSRSVALTRKFDLPNEAVECVVDEDSAHDDDEAPSTADDWHSFVSAIAEVAAKVAEFASEIADSYRRRLEENLAKMERLAELNGTDAKWLIAAVHTDVVIVSRLAHLQTNDGGRSATTSLKFAQNLTQAIKHAIENKSNFGLGLASRLTPDDFDHYLSALLLCARSQAAWLAQFYAEAQRTGDGNLECSALITTLLGAAVVIVADSLKAVDEPTTLARTAASLLFSLLHTVRPHSFALEFRPLSNLYQMVCEETIAAHRLLHPKMRPAFVALCGYLLFPWRLAADEEQEWDGRRRLLSRLLQTTVAQSLRAVCSADIVASAEQLVALETRLRLVLPPLNDLLDATAGEATKTKALLLEAIGGGELALAVVHLISEASKRHLHILVDQSLGHLSVLLRTLCVQLGAEFSRRVIDMLIALVDSNELLGSVALISLMRILQTLMEQISKEFAGFTRDVVNLTIADNLRQSIGQETTAVEAKDAYYELLFALLNARWRFFFPATVSGGSALFATTTTESDSMYFSAPKQEDPSLELIAKRSELLCTMLSVVITGIGSESQPALVKRMLNSLSALDEKYNLFRKPIVQSQLFVPLMGTLVKLFVEDRFPMLVEDLLDTAYRCVNGVSPAEALRQFSGLVIPGVVRDYLGMFDVPYAIWEQLNFELHEDRPSFGRELTGLVGRLRVVRMQQVITDDLTAQAANISC